MNSLASSVYRDLPTAVLFDQLCGWTIAGVGVVLIVHFRELAAADVSVNGNIHDILSLPLRYWVCFQEKQNNCNA